MTPKVVLLDANVLYQAPLRDLLLQLAYDDVFGVRWSTAIEDEWTRNLLAARPDLAEQLCRTQGVMRRAFPDAVVTGYADHVPRLLLPDPDDRHVLAAAITASAEVIVTFNLKDFPTSALAPHGIEALHPDAFLTICIESGPADVEAAVRTCLGRLTRPTMSAAAYLNNLRAVGLTETAAFLDGKLL